MSKLPLLFAFAFTVGCTSDDSGVDPNKRLLSLSSSEEGSLCNYGVSVEAGPRTVTCSDGSTTSVASQSACVASFSQLSASCSATVADAESCYQAIGADPCNGGGSSACLNYLLCFFVSN